MTSDQARRYQVTLDPVEGQSRLQRSKNDISLQNVSSSKAP